MTSAGRRRGGILIVVMIIAAMVLLAALATLDLSAPDLRAEQTRRTAGELKRLEGAIWSYAEGHGGQLPSDLDALRGVYLSAVPDATGGDPLEDAWHRPYRYVKVSDAPRLFHLYSFGPDGVDNERDGDDILSSSALARPGDPRVRAGLPEAAGDEVLREIASIEEQVQLDAIHTALHHYHQVTLYRFGNPSAYSWPELGGTFATESLPPLAAPAMGWLLNTGGDFDLGNDRLYYFYGDSEPRTAMTPNEWLATNLAGLGLSRNPAPRTRAYGRYSVFVPAVVGTSVGQPVTLYTEEPGPDHDRLDPVLAPTEITLSTTAAPIFEFHVGPSPVVADRHFTRQYWDLADPARPNDPDHPYDYRVFVYYATCGLQFTDAESGWQAPSPVWSYPVPYLHPANLMADPAGGAADDVDRYWQQPPRGFTEMGPYFTNEGIYLDEETGERWDPKPVILYPWPGIANIYAPARSTLDGPSTGLSSLPEGPHEHEHPAVTSDRYNRIGYWNSAALPLITGEISNPTFAGPAHFYTHHDESTHVDGDVGHMPTRNEAHPGPDEIGAAAADYFLNRESPYDVSCWGGATRTVGSDTWEIECWQVEDVSPHHGCDAPWVPRSPPDSGSEPPDQERFQRHNELHLTGWYLHQETSEQHSWSESDSHTSGDPPVTTTHNNSGSHTHYHQWWRRSIRTHYSDGHPHYLRHLHPHDHDTQVWQIHPESRGEPRPFRNLSFDPQWSHHRKNLVPDGHAAGFILTDDINLLQIYMPDELEDTDGDGVRQRNQVFDNPDGAGLPYPAANWWTDLGFPIDPYYDFATAPRGAFVEGTSATGAVPFPLVYGSLLAQAGGDASAVRWDLVRRRLEVMGFLPDPAQDAEFQTDLSGNSYILVFEGLENGSLLLRVRRRLQGETHHVEVETP